MARLVEHQTGDLSCWCFRPLALPVAQARHDVEQTWLIDDGGGQGRDEFFDGGIKVVAVTILKGT